MLIVIESEELSKIIYDYFVGDCECNTECYKHCNDDDCKSCVDSINKTLLDLKKDSIL